MHLSTGPAITKNVYKVYCPVDAGAGVDGLHMLKPVIIAAAVVARAEHVVFLVGLHLVTVVADVWRWGSWRLVHVLVLLRVGVRCQIHEARWGTTRSTPGP